MTIEYKLCELGIELPPPPPAVAAYRPWSRTGNLVITSGQLPWKSGKIAYAGRLGEKISVEEGYQAARLCAINAIAQLKNAVGNLERIAQIVRLEGFVHCAPGFRRHPDVLDGASHLFEQVFGERNKHSRLALGISDMPLDAAVQLTVMAEIVDESNRRASVESREQLSFAEP
ncbi:MAG TPA: RidA family protein [Pirellulales bacterium]|nr:RidA family protein [Pirellulales bacterium]